MGCSLSEIDSIPVDEHDLMYAYAKEYGLPFDRLENQLAYGFAQLNRTLNGPKLEPKDFMPTRPKPTIQIPIMDKLNAWAVGRNASGKAR